ncbi:hypothetical protein D3C84_775220 [compost metagenome]
MRPAEGDLDTLIPVIIPQGLQQFRQIKLGRRFKPRIVPKEFQRRIDHRLHFIHVTEQPLLLLGILDEFAAQTHARQRCTQVMGNGREHLRAVADEVLQLGLHGVEGEDRLADFLGAEGFDGRGAEVHAKAAGTFSETLQGCGEAASGDQCDQRGGDQHQQDDDQVTRRFVEAPTA